MLKELYLEYGDGRTETKIIHLEPGEQVKIYPLRDNITTSNCKTFKYQVEKHPYLCLAIVKLGDQTYIYPSKTECHPKTTLDDVLEIDNTQPKEESKPREKHTWKFKSSNSDSTYVVREKWGKLKCDCPGTWRAKDRRCKHIQEVEKELNKNK